jgi:uncharacterized YccA/Bax inhibitor family protein
MANPVFNRSPIFSEKAAARAAAAPPVPSAGQLQTQYEVPSASPDEMGRMTYEDTLVKTGVSFAILLVGAVIGWLLGSYLIVTIGAAIIGLVLGLVNTFKREPSPALILAYAFFEGIFVGGISMLYTLLFGSTIVPMAVFGTLGVVGVTLALFASGKIRASKRATQIFIVAIVGYGAFSLVNFGLMLTGVTTSMFGLRDIPIPGTNIPIVGPSRLLDEPNDVLVSSTLRDLVIGSGLLFDDRGTHQLKGVPGDWHLFAVAAS